MASKVANTTLVVCLPPLGKPDPKEPRPESGPDTRKRVIQLGSKDNTCWYYVFNCLRPRYKAPNTEKLEGRIFEKLASERRKAVSKHEGSLPNICNQLSDPLVAKLLNLGKDACKRPQVQSELQILSIPSSRIEEFLKQDLCNNLHEFLTHLKFGGRCKINEEFLKSLKIDPKTLFEQFQKEDSEHWKAIYDGKSLEELGIQARCTLLDSFVRRVSAEKYGIQLSNWKPSDSFASFSAELKKRGFLAISGVFGKVLYDDKVAPTYMGIKINGRKVYSWKKSDPMLKDRIVAHMILVVNTRTWKGRDWVYFIDPLDASDPDPKRKEEQAIYATPYSFFTSANYLCDTSGIRRLNAPPSVGYAWYAGNPTTMPQEQKEDTKTNATTSGENAKA